ncbi:alpha/beta hydrolase family protein [Nocardiopsis mangrovi]|uniref:Alpha/beta hydrolase family protein n=1 Tax=Nocardiopsis mangrovi TaxID=1179818 RepID=A0ABV9DQK8_9ACTN
MPFASAAVRTAALSAAVLLAASACSGQEDPAGPPEPPGAAPVERDVSFDSGPDTVYGTFALPPDARGRVPAALIISGSGPTDRDGDNPMRPDAGTNENFARLLADAGVASLRYDKLGSGETGMGARDEDDSVGYDVFEQEMADAYAQLAAQPEVDPDRLLVLGHSEGALFALRAPEAVRDHPPAALVLAAPPGGRYLDTVDRQLTDQIRLQEGAGALEPADAARVLSDTRAAIALIRSGERPEQDPVPELGGLFDPSVAPFLHRIDAMDPVDLAGDLPGDVDTLVLWGTADSQIARGDVDRLMTGLLDAERVDVEGADHVFRVYDDAPGAAVLDAQRAFSPDVAPALSAFLDSAVRP